MDKLTAERMVRKIEARREPLETKLLGCTKDDRLRQGILRYGEYMIELGKAQMVSEILNGEVADGPTD